MPKVDKFVFNTRTGVRSRWTEALAKHPHMKVLVRGDNGRLVEEVAEETQPKPKSRAKAKPKAE